MKPHWAHSAGAPVFRAGLVYVAAAYVLCAAVTRAAMGLAIEPLWVADPDMIMEGAAMVADLDGDGSAEVVTAAYESIIVVDGAGTERWRFDGRGRYSTCPALLERPGQPPLIYAGDNTGLLTCLDGHGDVVWQRDIAPVFCSSPAVADLNGDGTLELVQGSLKGTLSVFNALTGAPLWTRDLGADCGSPAVGDIHGDGRPEIVMATGAGKLFALDAEGTPLWEFALGGTAPDWAICSAVIYGDASGRAGIAAGSREGRLVCLDGTGGVVWERMLRGGVASTISAGDIDGDGRADLFVVTELGVLYRFDEQGRVVWDIDTQGRSLAPGALVDLDGDGALEYLLCTQQGSLLAFDKEGAVVFTHQFDSRTINVTAAFGDIVPGRPGLEFAVTGGESGRVLCFGLSASVDARAEWRSYRCDNRLTGAWFGLSSEDAVRMTPENLEWDRLVSGEGVMFRVTNPGGGDAVLTAQATCVLPDGSRQAALGKVVGRQGVLQLPVSAAAPGPYRFAWTLSDGSGRVMTAGSRELTLHPYQNDQALARRAVLAMEAFTGGEAEPQDGKGVTAALARVAQDIQSEAAALMALQASVPGAAPGFREEVDARTASLNTRARRALALAGVAADLLASAPDVSLAPFAGTLWENRDVDQQLPESVVLPLRISRRCVPGEHEPVSIKLLNMSAEPAAVTVRATTPSAGPAVRISTVKPAPTNQRLAAWDPIVPLGDEGLAIPPLEVREVWVDLDCAGVQPGSCEIRLDFEAGASQSHVEIALDVLPFEMAGFDQMRLCCWASYTPDAVRDLLAHGNTVFTAPLPPVTVREGQAPALNIDFAALDEFLALLAGHDVYLLMQGIPELAVPMESDAYVPRLADYLNQVLGHLQERGIAEERVALYPHDEPGGHGWDTVNHYVAFGRQGRKARPNLQFYVNGGGDLAMFEALGEVASVWCPSFYMLSEDSPEMAYLRKSGRTLWSYDCAYMYARPIGANTKTINVAAQYRMAAIHGWHFGATGIGFWCYNVGPSMWEAIPDEYPLVYVNQDGTHTVSRRWEAVREGMEDARMLMALRERLADPAVNEGAKRRIRNLFEETVASNATQSLNEAHLGVARYGLDATNNDATVAEFRERLMDCIAALTQHP